MQHEAAGTLIINLNALTQNYQKICAYVGPSCRAGAVLKANAYGLGAEQVAGTLYAAGCRYFFVAKPEEGRALKHLPEDAKIIILNGFYNSFAKEYLENGWIPVLGSFMEIERYRALAEESGRKLPAYLKFNIRMNRLGLGSVETKELLQNMGMLDGIDVQCVMGHFACADQKDHPMTALQYEIFKEIAEKIETRFPNVMKSLANSSGIFRSSLYHFDLVRPGMALYGLNPTPEEKNPMQAVVSVSLPVIRLRVVYEGATTGYGATYRFDQDTPLAVVSAGYADGLFRTLGNRGALYWKGVRCPIRGMISMDLTTVDLSAVPKAQRPRPGDELEFLGPHQSADEVAQDAGTISYEILTGLGHRYYREYKN